MALLQAKMQASSAGATARPLSSRAPVQCRAMMSSSSKQQAMTMCSGLQGSSFSAPAARLSSVVTGRKARRAMVQAVQAYKDGEKLDRPLRVAVVGGGPSGACAAETLAKGGVETFLIERKMDNCKVCLVC